MLLDIVARSNCFVMNGRRDAEVEWTNVNANGRSVVDYIIVNEQVWNRSKQLCTVEHELDIGTDGHKLLWMEYMWKRKRVQQPPVRRILKYRTERLKEPRVRDQFETRMAQDFKDWETKVGTLSIDALWNDWKAIVLKVCDDIIGKKVIKKGKSKPWMNHEKKDLIKQRKEAWIEAMRYSDKPHWQAYCMARKKVRDLVLRTKREIVLKFAEQIQDKFTFNKKAFWSMINHLGRGKVQKVEGIENERKEIVTSTADKKRVWADYFERLAKEEEEVQSPFDSSFKDLVRNEVKIRVDESNLERFKEAKVTS
jgi:hypothetical protein